VSGEGCLMGAVLLPTTPSSKGAYLTETASLVLALGPPLDRFCRGQRAGLLTSQFQLYL
jgi:hypothetical protein